jgi:hypothetical protein
MQLVTLFLTVFFVKVEFSDILAELILTGEVVDRHPKIRLTSGHHSRHAKGAKLKNLEIALEHVELGRLAG